MVNVDEASDIVFSNLFKPVQESIAIQQGTARVLAEEIRADRDFPPFHRIAMDGIAINFSVWQQGKREFLLEDTQAAGEPQKTLRAIDHALEVMTGAVLPGNVDTVIRYEDIEVKGNVAVIRSDKVDRWQNIHSQGQDAKQNEILLHPGIMLSPAEIALLASVGKSKVRVYAFPKAAVISTGDELVDVGDVPEPHQIRRSNAYAIEAAMEQMKWTGRQFHLPDRKDFLQESLRVIAADHDVLILSGGVSKGKFDFIPEVLEEIGIKKLFHQVSQRPGKPFWFGVSKKGKVIFALPGNPVSTYMCFYRYIKPWVLKSFGVETKITKAILARDYNFTPPLTYFLQVQVKMEEGKLMAYPDPGGGSGDFANLKNVNGFLELPLDRNEFHEGEIFPFYSFR